MPKGYMSDLSIASAILHAHPGGRDCGGTAGFQTAVVLMAMWEHPEWAQAWGVRLASQHLGLAELRAFAQRLVEATPIGEAFHEVT